MNYVADKLKSGAAEGLGGTTFGAADYSNTLKAFLDHNIYAFSSARSLYMLEQYRNFLTDAEGKLLSEAQFISKVADISEIDNVTHLKAERESAIASAQMAEKWETLTVHPLLQYRTVGDDRVRPEHAILDNLILRQDDPLWSTIYPPNGWNCRCTVVPAGAEEEVTPQSHAIDVTKAADIQPYFKRNVGESKLIYSDDHPYFRVKGFNHELDAEKNYGMRSGEKIYDMDTLPDYKPLNDKATANAWWQDQAGSQRGSFDMKGADDISVLFDNEFRNHILEDNSDDRFRFIKEIKNLLQNPDEVWTNRVKGSIHTIYIRYYQDAPMALITEADKSVRAVTMYEVKKGGKINYKALQNMRKGILKYRSR